MAWGSAFYASARGRMAAAAGAIATVAVAALTASSPGAVSCDRVAAPSGSDSAAGTAASPYRTTQKLADSLTPGQTGCLRSGLYEQDVKVTKGGGAGSPVTISSYPGERATLKGRLRDRRLGELRHGRVARPRRARRVGLPSPTRLRRRRGVPRQRRHGPSHRHLLPARVERLWPGEADDHRAQPDPRLRGAARASNHHHGIYVEASDDARITEQLDLRQRRPRCADVPGLAGQLHRGERDRRQRPGRQLRPSVGEQRRRAQRRVELGPALEHRGLGAVAVRATSRATTVCGPPGPTSTTGRAGSW